MGYDATQKRAHDATFEYSFTAYTQCMIVHHGQGLIRGATSTSQNLLYSVCSPHCVDLQVIMDKDTGRSKGYGFVKFTSSRSYDNALSEANGQVNPPPRLQGFHIPNQPGFEFPSDACPSVDPCEGHFSPGEASLRFLLSKGVKLLLLHSASEAHPCIACCLQTFEKSSCMETRIIID